MGRVETKLKRWLPLLLALAALLALMSGLILLVGLTVRGK